MQKDKIVVHYDFYVISGRNGAVAKTVADEAAKRARAFFGNDIDLGIDIVVDASSNQYTCTVRATGEIQ